MNEFVLYYQIVHHNPTLSTCGLMETNWGYEKISSKFGKGNGWELKDLLYTNSILALYLII